MFAENEQVLQVVILENYNIVIEVRTNGNALKEFLLRQTTLNTFVRDSPLFLLQV